MNKQIKKYIKDCKKIFPFYTRKEKSFFNHFEKNILEYYKDISVINYNDIVTHFGQPKDIMISYINNCDNDEIINKMNIRKILRNATIIISLIFIVGLSSIAIMEKITIDEIQNQEIITEDITIN
ncbi:DUF6120 family protein [Longibaculum muris]|uniref:DUF6120 family protein n=1 Tax=Longibaculum muris TaxID=1796628 RepID=UPI0022E775C1|nr:DUF6120 family protein [Longibaculum muris]